MRYRILAPIIGCARRSRPSAKATSLPPDAGSPALWGLLFGLLFAGGLILTADVSLAQQKPDANIPVRAVVVGLGLRDAGDLGTAWLAAVGVRLPVTRRVNGGLTVAHGEVVDQSCPATPGAPCRGGARLTGLDLELEFYYGGGVVHPYGVVSLGLGRLGIPEEDLSRTAFAYSTGVGLGGRAGSRAWLFLEGRWRQETFGVYSASGVLGAVGAKLGF